MGLHNMPDAVNTAIALLLPVGAFFAGWLVASSKNRSELYKRKLDAYDALFERIQEAVLLVISSHYDNLEDHAIVNAKIAIAQLRLSRPLYFSSKIQKLLVEFDPEKLDIDGIFLAMDEINAQAAKDLNIKGHSFLTRLANGELHSISNQ